MSIQTLRGNLPDYARDIKINLGNVLTLDGAPELSIAQIYGIALASAYATKNADLVSAMEDEASTILTDVDVSAVKGAVAIMGMNNIYYRFVHLSGDKEFSTMPANLRMNVINSSGAQKVDFELYSLAVSAINGCGMCIEAHARGLEKEGVSKKGIQSAIRIAAVINATAQVLAIEETAGQKDKEAAAA